MAEHLGTNHEIARKLQLSLLLLRLSIGLVMMVWAFDKILNPSHGAAVFEGFYGMAGVGETLVQGIGVAQALLVLAFVLGIARTWTYGAILLMHGATTLVSWSAYLQPLKNILFFAAWPMLAALITLFLLRGEDRMWSIGGRSDSSSR